MDDTLVRDALRAHIADEPPIGLTSRDVLAAGRRARRRHTVRATLLGSGAVAGVVGIAALALPALVPSFALDGGDRNGAPDAATCAAIRETSAYEQHNQIYAIPDAPGAADRVTCYLMATLPRYVSPGATFEPDPSRPGSAALVAVPDEDVTGEMTRYVTAGATVRDDHGVGVLFFAVGRNGDFDWAAAEQRCAPGGESQCHTGRHGEHIEVYDAGPDQRGVHVLTIYVQSGPTSIVASVSNAPGIDGAAPTRTDPPLTLVELIEITTDLDLRLYP